MTILLRGVIGLWGLLFAALAVVGIFDPGAWTKGFGVVAEGAAVNNLRADYGAFFLVAALGALWGAIQPKNAKALWVPAALFGAALVIRIIGLVMGDPLTSAIQQSMATELVSVVLMLFAARHFGKAVHR